MDYSDIVEAIVDHRYDDAANLIYKDVMARKYPDDNDYHKHIKINRERNTTAITTKLKQVYTERLRSESTIRDKLSREEKMDVAEEVYYAVELWLTKKLGLEPNHHIA